MGRPEKPTTKPCSEAANDATETLGSSCFLCAKKAPEEEERKGGKGGKGGKEARVARVAKEARVAREARDQGWLSLLLTVQPTSLSQQLARITVSIPLLAKLPISCLFTKLMKKNINWTQNLTPLN